MTAVHNEMVNKLSIKKPCYVYRYFQGLIVKTDGKQIQVNVMTEIKSNFNYTFCFESHRVTRCTIRELCGYFKKYILINCSNIYKQDNLSFPEGTTYKKKNRNFMESPYTL